MNQTAAFPSETDKNYPLLHSQSPSTSKQAQTFPSQNRKKTMHTSLTMGHVEPTL
jgi:hypothetical protein